MISVVIPTHNRPVRLLRALRSVEAQTEAADEVIVVDDGSVPPVDARALEEAVHVSTLRVIRTMIGGSANRARNTGIDVATGTFVAFLDDDDMFSSGKIKALRDAISTRPSVDVWANDAKVRIEGVDIEYWTTRPKGNVTFTGLLSGNIVGGTSRVTVRKEALERVGGFNVAMPAQQDWETWLRLARANCTFGWCENAFTYYVRDTSKASITGNSESLKKARELLDAQYAGIATKEHRRRWAVNRTQVDLLNYVFSDHRSGTEWLALLHRGVTLRSARLLVGVMVAGLGRKIFMWAWRATLRHQRRLVSDREN